jgi:hypothetical protein
MNVNVLDRDLLRALAAMAIERVEQHGKGAGDLAGLPQVFMLSANWGREQARPETTDGTLVFSPFPAHLGRRAGWFDPDLMATGRASRRRGIRRRAQFRDRAQDVSE